MQLSKSKISNLLKADEGFSLFEILIAISVFAVVSVVASQMIGASLGISTTSGRKTVAVGFAREAIEATQAIVTEKWHNIYNLNKGSSNKYYPTNTVAACGAAKWCLVAGEETITANDLTYKRYLYIENIARNTSGNIVSSGGADDPSTQKITIVVSWHDSAGAELGSVTMSDYFTRARNAVASQTSWTSGGSAPGSGETGNFGSGFSSQDGNIDTSSIPGSIKLTQ